MTQKKFYLRIFNLDNFFDDYKQNHEKKFFDYVTTVNIIEQKN